MARRMDIEDSELLAGVRERARDRRSGARAWTNAAFVVESLVLLVAIVSCIAIFTSLFAKASAVSTKAQETTMAVQLAQNAAEEFSSDPAAVAAGKAVGENAAGTSGVLAVKVEVDEEKCAAGTLYTAHISVVDTTGTSATAAGETGAELYSLDASRYVSEVR